MSIGILDQYSTVDQMKKWLKEFGSTFDRRWDREQDRKFAEIVEITAPVPLDACHAKVSRTRPDIQGVRYGLISRNMYVGRCRGFITGIHEGYTDPTNRAHGKDKVKDPMTVEERVWFCDW